MMTKRGVGGVLFRDDGTVLMSLAERERIGGIGRNSVLRCNSMLEGRRWTGRRGEGVTTTRSASERSEVRNCRRFSGDDFRLIDERRRERVVRGREDFSLCFDGVDELNNG